MVLFVCMCAYSQQKSEIALSDKSLFCVKDRTALEWLFAFETPPELRGGGHLDIVG